MAKQLPCENGTSFDFGQAPRQQESSKGKTPYTKRLASALLPHFDLARMTQRADLRELPTLRERPISFQWSGGYTRLLFHPYSQANGDQTSQYLRFISTSSPLHGSYCAVRAFKPDADEQLFGSGPQTRLKGRQR